MTNAIVQSERIEIRGFGSFNLHHRAQRIARNPKSGEYRSRADIDFIYYHVRCIRGVSFVT